MNTITMRGGLRQGMTATQYHNPLMKKYPQWESDRELREAGPDTLDFYFNRRAEGMSHNFAAMLACQRFPGTKTEVMYFEGRHTLADQFKGNEQQLDAVVSAARKRGYNPSPYDVYEPGLADDVGDPAAFIKPSGGTTELRRKLEASGRSCHGLVNVKGRAPVNETACAPLAPDIVDAILGQKLKSDPALAAKLKRQPKALREAREQIVAEHGFTDSKRTGAFGAHTPKPETVIKGRKTFTKQLTQKAKSLARRKKR
jgi:hypothetical protein